MPTCHWQPENPALQDKQTVDPNRVGGPTNALLGENALSTTIGAAGGLANDAASNALRRMAARSAAQGLCSCMQGADSQRHSSSY
jgi:hypothetical protein